MDEVKQSLNISRLIDREKYYKDKALKLEKSFIFANEKISALEEQLDALVKENQSLTTDKKQVTVKLKETQALYDGLVRQYEEDKKSARDQIQTLQNEIEVLQKNQRTEGDVGRSMYNQRVKGFEQLLAEMEVEINEKEKELSIYKRRLNVLEKRLKLHGEPFLAKKPDLSEKNTILKPEERAVPYIDYALIINDKRAMIRGDLIIENVGSQPLDTPHVCFRFTPGDAAELKGKILSWEGLGEETIEQESDQWAFLNNDWAEEAKERGEIWVYPLTPMKLEPGERVILPDWQMPFEKKYVSQLAVEVFVYFQGSNYRTKSVNQILVNF
ncbi:hypothetical protein ACFO4N_15650 [Camelliibacillus cellulosilyticus]|uniref:Uncharacterized protein n=1 Tax=Camelliibacillus cellulosilyticus TaxID=2174486 RepID=A0ABV9GT59_9BACL